MSGAATWAAAAVAAAALGACSSAAPGDRPKPMAGAARQAAAAVERLDRAVRARDWRTVCDSLFTAAARLRAGGQRTIDETLSARRAAAGYRIESLDG